MLALIVALSSAVRAQAGEQLETYEDMWEQYLAPHPRQFVVDDVEASIGELAEDNSQLELWEYAMAYELHGEGAGLQAVRSAAEALLTDETKIPFTQIGTGPGARMRAHPRLAAAANDAIRGSTPRTANVAADAHVLLFFLQGSDVKDHLFSEDAEHHMSEATRLRPHHGRQWMLFAMIDIARKDWRAALEKTRKSRDYAANEYERWGMEMHVGQCLQNIPELRHEARAVLESTVEVPFATDNTLGINDRDRKNAIAAQFILVTLILDDRDLDAATAQYESAMSRFAKLPPDLKSMITQPKAAAGLQLEAARNGLHRFQTRDGKSRLLKVEKVFRPDKTSTPSWAPAAVAVLVCLFVTILVAGRYYLQYLDRQAGGEKGEQKKRPRATKAEKAAKQKLRAATVKQEAAAAKARAAEELAHAAWATEEATKAQAAARRAVLEAKAAEEKDAEREDNLVQAKVNAKVKAVKEKLQEEAKDATKCVVCLDSPKTHLLQPCGHYCICSECLEEMKGFVASLRICPMCREPFKSSQRVWDAGR